MKWILKFTRVIVALVAAFIIMGKVPEAKAQVSATTLYGTFTNTTVAVTNGATTFAGTTNVTIAVWQNTGLGFGFSAYATNPGQLTFYLVPSIDGTNYADALAPIVWGNTLNASGWITRATNIPNSVLDNYRTIKVLIASNSAASVIISNAVFTRH